MIVRFSTVTLNTGFESSKNPSTSPLASLGNNVSLIHKHGKAQKPFNMLCAGVL